MGASYAIYDTWTANLVGAFPDEASALETVRRAVEEDGPEAVDGWALARTNHTGEVLAGKKLIDRAMPQALSAG